MINRFYYYSWTVSVLIALTLIFCIPPPANTSSLAGAVKGLKPGQVNSLKAMKTALSLLQTAHLETIKNNKPIRMYNCMPLNGGAEIQHAFKQDERGNNNG